jgi:hypothetical protein
VAVLVAQENAAGADRVDVSYQGRFDVIEQLGTLPAWLTLALQILAFVSVVIWLRLRSGSPHVLRTRLWALAQGRSQPGDQPIQAFLSQRSSLMQFRVVTGVRSPTIQHTHRLMTWLHDHEEEVGDVARCGGYFDVRLPGLSRRLPSKTWLFFFTLVFSLCVGIIMLAGLTMLSGRALVSVLDGSGRLMWLATSDVRVLHTTQHFGPSDCDHRAHTAIAAAVGLPSNEVDIACRWFGDRSLPEKIRESVHQQRIVLLLMVALALGYGLPAYGAFTTAKAARAMRARLQARGASGLSVPLSEAAAATHPAEPSTDCLGHPCEV